jgi:DNA polymerase
MRKADPFDALAAAAQACRACPTMDGRLRVLTRANGPAPAAVLLVGEAPGRLGAGRCGVPFAGDESGRRLDALLAAAQWRRDEVFITNAVLCNPRNERGNNRTPTTHEWRACSGWLARQIEVVAPELVVALGAVALAALDTVAPHRLRVRDAGTLPVTWLGRHLAAAYHPGARAAIHRPVARQREDFARLGSWVRERRPDF